MHCPLGCCTGAARLRCIVRRDAARPRQRRRRGVSLTSTPTATDTDALAAYVREIERWRAHRVDELTAPDGWLTLIGLEWLRPGPNRIGAADENDVVLAAGPAHLGVIMLSADGRAHLQLAPGVDARIDGENRT